MLSVAVDRSWPYTTWPAQARQDPDCPQIIGVAAELVVVLLRCMPQPRNGKAPTCEAMTETARVVNDDLAAIWTAIGCCPWTDRWLVQSVRPVRSPLCVGWEARVVIDPGRVCCVTDAEFLRQACDVVDGGEPSGDPFDCTGAAPAEHPPDPASDYTTVAPYTLASPGPEGSSLLLLPDDNSRRICSVSFEMDGAFSQSAPFGRSFTVQFLDANGATQVIDRDFGGPAFAAALGFAPWPPAAPVPIPPGSTATVDIAGTAVTFTLVAGVGLAMGDTTGAWLVREADGNVQPVTWRLDFAPAVGSVVLRDGWHDALPPPSGAFTSIEVAQTTDTSVPAVPASCTPVLEYFERGRGMVYTDLDGNPHALAGRAVPAPCPAGCEPASTESP